ncbi:MAG: acyl-CoA dehydrogenase family protein [Actinomycetota bacterium]|nr:acyl-CoA dehydrogenase family protein [Actinomycetota bacterium]
MEFSYGIEAEKFRRELQAWLQTNLPPDLARETTTSFSDATFDRLRHWNATLVDAGWGAIDWPARFGGRDATVLEQLVYQEEMAAAHAPGPVNAIGVANIAPAIMTLGTAEQQDRHLRPMLRGDEIWSQGMSEPGAGSDLASLSCRAIRDGDHFVVSGQKTWTSLGHRADWCQLYVRTDPDAPKHEGITCLLVDLRVPGIEARSIRSMGGDHGFAELFFDDVAVPVSAVLGEIGSGWHVATRTLGFERAGVAKLYLMMQASLDRLLNDAGEDVRADPIARQRIASAWIDTFNLRLLSTRTISAAVQGRVPGAEGSVVKLAWSLGEQHIAELAVDLLGPDALQSDWGRRLIASRSLTIAGGTTEVNKNIIGERVLGLPREPSA